MGLQTECHEDQEAGIRYEAAPCLPAITNGASADPGDAVKDREPAAGNHDGVQNSQGASSAFLSGCQSPWGRHISNPVLGVSGKCLVILDRKQSVF